MNREIRAVREAIRRAESAAGESEVPAPWKQLMTASMQLVDLLAGEDRQKGDLVIFGAGGFGRQALAISDDIGTYDFVGWLDDDPALAGKYVHGGKILGGSEWLGENPDTWVVIAVGNSKARRRIAQKLCEAGHSRFATLVHPNVWRGPNVSIGRGAIVSAGCSIDPDVTIGDFVFLNKGCTVGHDAIIREFGTAYPGVNISGNVDLGPAIELGTGSAIIQGLTIGSETIVGAGAVVVRDLPGGITAVGVPAKPLQRA